MVEESTEVNGVPETGFGCVHCSHRARDGQDTLKLD